MATTITPSSLTVQLTATIQLGAKSLDIDVTESIASVTNADKRIVPIPTSEVDIVQVLSAVVGKGTFEDYNFAIFVNRDDTNFVRIRAREGGGDTADFRIDAGQFMIFWNTKIETNTTAAAFGAFVDFDTFAFQADTASVDLEYLVAQV